MEKSHLQFDISIAKYQQKEDLIEIRFQNEEVFRVNFSKLIRQSKYIRDKYKYSEAINSIQTEFDEIVKKYDINEESIKFFIQLIQDEKVSLPIEHYKDIYTLSEYFYVPSITSELDNISKNKLFNDLNFTIQLFHDYESVDNGFETKLLIKIENFLIERINECILIPKFCELPISTIYRIFDESKGQFDHNLLLDFILETAPTRFIMFKFIEIDKISSDKVTELIKFIEEQEETTKKMYMEYMTFNLAMIKNLQNLQNKYDQLFKEMNQTKEELNQIKHDLNKEKMLHNQTEEELNQTKHDLNKEKMLHNQAEEELNQTKEDLNQEKMSHNQTEEELNQEKMTHNQTKEELNQEKTTHNQTKEELNREKMTHNQTMQELDECKRKLNQSTDVFNQRKSENKRYTQSIIVGGYDAYNHLGEKPNNNQIISPPVKLPLDPSSLLTYSVYCNHSVLVMSDGSLKGVGDNSSGQISATLQKTDIDHFTNFCIKDGSGRQLAAISAVCCQRGTLYMFSKSSGNERQLVLCDEDINGGDPVFLDIGNHHPVSLFGGLEHSAAIGSEGEVIYINRDSVKNSPKSPIAAVSLPGGEKASSVACCSDSVVVLSSNGRVFSSRIESNRVLNFSIVSELSDQEIVCVSGTFYHCLAVSKEGRVFGRGSNNYGQLGLGKKTGSVSSFTKILSLVGYEIRAAYAGYAYSLFETREGKILSCGYNYCGELLLSSGPGEDVYSPTETTITNGAAFCITGNVQSAVFIGSGAPPNTPNIRIQQYD